MTWIEPPNNVGVHVAHCCRKHGCKYGDTDCPVVTGHALQVYPCESCEWERDDLKNTIKYLDDYESDSLMDMYNEIRLILDKRQVIIK